MDVLYDDLENYNDANVIEEVGILAPNNCITSLMKIHILTEFIIKVLCYRYNIVCSGVSLIYCILYCNLDAK